MNSKILPRIILFVTLTMMVMELSNKQAKSADDDSWWLTPHRLLQTNLREIDATMDTEQYVREVKEFGANIVLFNVGGIIALIEFDFDFLISVHCSVSGSYLAEEMDRL